MVITMAAVGWNGGSCVDVRISRRSRVRWSTPATASTASAVTDPLKLLRKWESREIATSVRTWRTSGPT